MTSSWTIKLMLFKKEPKVEFWKKFNDPKIKTSEILKDRKEIEKKEVKKDNKP